MRERVRERVREKREIERQESRWSGGKGTMGQERGGGGRRAPGPMVAAPMCHVLHLQ